MKFLLRDDLKTRGIRFSNKHLLHLERLGRFPKRFPVAEGGKLKGWLESEIEAYQTARLSNRGEAT